MEILNRFWRWLTAPAEARGEADNPPDPPYLLMCLGVGLLGLLLPLILLLGDALFLTGKLLARDSLSAYYYTSMRDVFVGILVAIAPLLITYKLMGHRLPDGFWGFGFDVTPENIVSIVAGLAAVFVAWFPTAIPDWSHASPTPLQTRLGEKTVSTIHYSSAVFFILFLGIMCLLFAREEGQRSGDAAVRGYESTRSPTFWKRFYIFTATVIFLMLIFMGVAQLFHVLNDYSLLIGESIVVFAFGLSWLMKGWEVFKLRPSVRAKRSMMLSESGRQEMRRPDGAPPG